MRALKDQPGGATTLQVTDAETASQADAVGTAMRCQGADEGAEEGMGAAIWGAVLCVLGVLIAAALCCLAEAA